jgi:hypothetical protein
MAIEDNIAPGKVLRLSVCMPADDRLRDKLFVVASTDPILLLKINTSGEQTAIAKKFKETQFKITKAVYGFLYYDSYLDCGTVWYSLITREEMVKQLKKDNKRVLGELTTDHRNEVIRLTNNSKSITPLHKRIIAVALARKTSL